MRQLDIVNPFGAPVFHEKTVTSTMAVSRSLASEGAKHGTVIAADFQEAGRGRTRERAWLMDRNASLPFTILLRYGQPEAVPRALTLRAGLAVALAVGDAVPSIAGTVTVKWPNDIMIGGKKAAGILTEAGGGDAYIGIGINVAQNEFPGFLRDKAISVSLAAGEALPPEARFTLLEKTLSRLYSELETPGWRGRLMERLYKKGEQVCFIAGEADSGCVVEGRLEGIGPGGELLITPRGESETKAFVNGELRVY